MLCCLICGEILDLPEALRDEEIANATRGFLEDHIHLHGGDPEKVPFSLAFEGNLVRAIT